MAEQEPRTMYIIYNSDGSIKYKNLYEIVTQGSDNATQLLVAFEDRPTPDYTLTGYVTLPSGEHLAAIVTEEEASIIIEGVEYIGVVISFDETMTSEKGILKLVVVAESETSKLASFVAYININEGLALDAVMMLSTQQFQSFIESYNTNNFYTKAETNELLDGKVDKASGYSLVADTKVSSYDAHLSNNSNPHNVTKAQVGLANADNTSDATKKSNFTGQIAENDTGFVTGGDAYTALNNKADKNTTINGHALSGNITITKADIGLSSVVNSGDSSTPSANGTDKFTTGGAYLLQQEINNLKNIGRFLSIWNANTGVAETNPPESPYTYKVGDYFRVGTGGNRIPTGSTYVIGGSNYTTTTEALALGDLVYFDGTVWQRQAKGQGGDVYDVQIDGTSILVGGIANITKASLGLGNVDNTSDETKKANFTGSIESGNTGFVTGGAAYTALNTRIPKSVFTTKGDLLVGNGSGAYSVLGIGSRGKVLTVGANDTLSYATPTFATLPELEGPGSSAIISEDLALQISKKGLIMNGTSVSTGSQTTGGSPWSALFPQESSRNLNICFYPGKETVIRTTGVATLTTGVEGLCIVGAKVYKYIFVRRTSGTFPDIEYLDTFACTVTLKQDWE